tara:strand:- start:181 stop:303 length:123 start_codon:yes stop_codon:yes gene_type:complete
MLCEVSGESGLVQPREAGGAQGRDGSCILLQRVDDIKKGR